MEIRLASASDAQTLARMRFEFRARMNEASESEDAFIARCAPWMAERLHAGSPWRCWIAHDGRRVAGHLWLQLIEKVPNPAPELEQHAYITNVYVDRSERGAGIGRQLMEAALQFCRENNVDSVIPWPTEKSRTLYARHGFQVPQDMMEVILDPGRDLH
jgi:GNAT superfamily N-acetyltransferase